MKEDSWQARKRQIGMKSSLFICFLMCVAVWSKADPAPARQDAAAVAAPARESSWQDAPPW